MGHDSIGRLPTDDVSGLFLWLLHMCDSTICVAWLIYRRDMTRLVGSLQMMCQAPFCESFIFTSSWYIIISVAWLTYMWDTTRFVGPKHDVSGTVSWLLPICDSHSRRRIDWEYLDLQITQFSCIISWVTGTPVYCSENLYEILGTPVKPCLKVTGTPVKTCLKFWRSL